MHMEWQRKICIVVVFFLGQSAGIQIWLHQPAFQWVCRVSNYVVSYVTSSNIDSVLCEKLSISHNFPEMGLSQHACIMYTTRKAYTHIPEQTLAINNTL